MMVQGIYVCLNAEFWARISQLQAMGQTRGETEVDKNNTQPGNYGASCQGSPPMLLEIPRLRVPRLGIARASKAMRVRNA